MDKMGRGKMLKNNDSSRLKSNKHKLTLKVLIIEIAGFPRRHSVSFLFIYLFIYTSRRHSVSFLFIYSFIYTSRRHSVSFLFIYLFIYTLSFEGTGNLPHTFHSYIFANLCRSSGQIMNSTNPIPIGLFLSINID